MRSPARYTLLNVDGHNSQSIWVRLMLVVRSRGQYSKIVTTTYVTKHTLSSKTVFLQCLTWFGRDRRMNLLCIPYSFFVYFWKGGNGYRNLSHRNYLGMNFEQYYLGLNIGFLIILKFWMSEIHSDGWNC